MGLGPTHPGAALPFFCHNGDPLSQPPPAHMGIPPYQLDGKAATMGEFSPGDWRRLGPLLAATGIHPTLSGDGVIHEHVNSSNLINIGGGSGGGQ